MKHYNNTCMKQAKNKTNMFTRLCRLFKQAPNKFYKLLNMARVQLTLQQHASTFKWARNK